MRHKGENTVENQNEITEKKKIGGIKKYFLGKILIILLVVVVAAMAVISLRNKVFYEEKTTKIGFEDIGELATQVAYCTEVNVTDASREMFGVKIPFTQSKYIYSYDVIIKAGFDFTEIKWSIKENTIVVRLPKAKVLSSEIDPDSFKLYHEDESIFREITMTENNEAMKNMQKNAKKDAIANGLLENARSNAETILTGYFASAYDLEEYEIKFKDK